MTCPWTPIVDASPRSWILSPRRLRLALGISALATKTWSCSLRAPPDIPSGRIGAPRRFDPCCEPGWPRLLSPPAHRPSSVVPLPAPWEVVYRCIPEPVFTGAAHTLQQQVSWRLPADTCQFLLFFLLLFISLGLKSFLPFICTYLSTPDSLSISPFHFDFTIFSSPLLYVDFCLIVSLGTACTRLSLIISPFSFVNGEAPARCCPILDWKM